MSRSRNQAEIESNSDATSAVDGEFPSDVGNEKDKLVAAPLDPAVVAARLLLKRALRSGGLRDLAEAEGVVAVVEVASADWLAPVAEAWRSLAGDRVPFDGDRDARWARLSKSKWIEFRRDGSDRAKDRPDVGNVDVCHALCSARGIVGFSTASEKYLPSALLEAADYRIELPSVDRAALRVVVRAVIGSSAGISLSDVECGSISATTLRLARRRGQSAADYVTRLERLVRRPLKTPPEEGVRLDDLNGMDEAVAWGRSLAHDLADFKAGKLAWSMVDRGALLFGPPGTGKTTFAQALARSCDVPLIAASLGQWQASGTGHLGDLLVAMRRSFAEARKLAPCILLVDEIDSFGNRSSFKHAHKDYSIQVVNGFLEELGGVEAREGVVVIGACNNPHLLDPAITRSGRLDRAIGIPLPDEVGLAKILRFHLRDDLLDTDLNKAAFLGIGGTGADAERWVRGARRRARHDRRQMVLDDLLQEIRGPERARSDASIARSAVHEAGHALAIVIERPGGLMKVTVREFRSADGVTFANPDEEPLTHAEVGRRLRVLLAGRAAEQIVFGDVSGGAGGGSKSDLARATALATASLGAFGLGHDHVGLVWLGLPDIADVGRMLAANPRLTAQASAMLDDAYRQVLEMLGNRRSDLELVAKELLARETLTGADVEALIRQPTQAAEFEEASPPMLRRGATP